MIMDKYADDVLFSHSIKPGIKAKTPSSPDETATIAEPMLTCLAAARLAAVVSCIHHHLKGR